MAQDLDHRWDTVGFIALGAAYLDLGLPEKAKPLLEQARAIGLGHRILFSLRNSTALLAASYLAQGQNDQVVAMLATAFGDGNSFPSDDEPAPTLSQRLCWFVRAGLALHEGCAAAALIIVDHLLGWPGTTSPTIETGVARLLQLRGDALLVLQRQEEAEQAYSDALEAAIYQGIGSLVWRLHLALGRLLKEHGERHAAAAQVEHARSLVDALAATLPTPGLQQEFLDHARAHFPTPPTLTPLRARKQNAGGLTAHEYEIAILIQRGNSDRKIAEALSLSKRTVGTHVSNILAKLNFTLACPGGGLGSGKRATLKIYVVPRKKVRTPHDVAAAPFRYAGRQQV